MTSTDDAWDDSYYRCFPRNSTVFTPDGPIDIQDVKVGDEVLAMDDKGELLYSEVWTLSHHDPEATMKVVCLTTESGATLRLSPGHYLPTVGEDGTVTFTLAGEVKVGAVLRAGRQAGQTAAQEKVVAVEEEEARGKFSLLTMEGNLVVEGLVASCFEEHAHPRLAQPALAPFRLAYRWLPLGGWLLNYKWAGSSLKGIPVWAGLALRYVAPLLPREL